MTPRRQIAIALRVLGRDETAQIIRIAQWQAARTYREGCGASIKTYQTQAVLWRLRWEVRRALRRGLVWGSAQWSALDSSDEASPAARCASPGPSTEDVVEARRVAARAPIHRQLTEGYTTTEIGKRMARQGGGVGLSRQRVQQLSVIEASAIREGCP